MPLTYTLARIFTSEESRYKGKPLYLEIVNLVNQQKISARCHVTKSIAGCYENGEIATHGIEVLSFNMPLEITVIMPQHESVRLLPLIEEMVDEGLMTVEDQEVHWHKCRKRMIPRQIRVRDVMTPAPRTLAMDAPASEAMRILLGARFHGIPVVDAQNRPVGMVTHGDLFRHPAMPIKVGLLRNLDPGQLCTMEKVLAGTSLGDLMSKPLVTIKEDELLAKAVDVMLDQDLKRLPVVDGNGGITGILSRLDVFKTIMDKNPDWVTFDHHGVKLQELALVKDAMRTDTPTLPPSAPIWDAIKLIDTTSILRVAVVDPEGKLLGLVSERVLLAAFSAHKGGLLDLIVNKLSFTALARKHAEMLKAMRAGTVGEIMLKDIYSVTEEEPIEAALQLMVEKKLKRVPVLDGQGRFKGMLTRDSLLRAIQPPQGGQ
jgi:CBS domain-containing protein